MSLVRRLLSPEYWVVPNPGLPGKLWVLYALAGFGFLCSVILSACWILSARRGRAGPTDRLEPVSLCLLYGWFELSVSLAGLLSVAARLLAWPTFSARIWSPFLAALALLGLLLHRMRACQVPARLHQLLYTLALLPTEEPPPSGMASPQPAPRRVSPRTLYTAIGLGLHLTGVALVLRARFGLPGWLAPAALAAITLPQIGPILAHRRLSLRALTPLLVGYFATFVWAACHRLGITVVGWQGLAFPDPMTSFFYLDAMLLASLVHAWLCQLFASRLAWTHHRPHDSTLRRLLGGKPWQWIATLLTLTTALWAIVTYLGKRTAGATGSDPYAYAQMAVDLAARGTLLHRFPLFQTVAPLGIPWGPVLPVGYHLPISALGDSPSVWATGASVLLAAGYRLIGEAGLYVTTPILALASLVATALLVNEALRRESKAMRYLVAALTVALTASSPEHVDRLLVPMADAAAQLFTVLALFFCLRAMHLLEARPRRALLPLILCGLSFAWAYWVRHTQLVLFLPISLGLWLAAPSRRTSQDPRRAAAGQNRRIWPILLVSVSAALMAIPDVLYRWRVFGGLFSTETTELASMALRNIGPVALQTLQESLVAGEWGYLFPFALIGSIALAQADRRAFAVLGTAFAAVLFVHLTYHFLRLRDLISLFPLVNLAVSYGAMRLIRSARASTVLPHRPPSLGAVAVAVGAIAWVILAFSLARWTMIDDPLKPGWASFGYMRPEQRAAFDRLADLTPANAVIGTSLNSGAVLMYTGRDSFRPYDGWSENDWAAFVRAIRADSRPIYLLDDGEPMAGFIRDLTDDFRLVPVAPLAIPLFSAPGRQAGWLYEVVRQE